MRYPRYYLSSGLSLRGCTPGGLLGYLEVIQQFVDAGPVQERNFMM
jgi:hypothetical protein